MFDFDVLEKNLSLCYPQVLIGQFCLPTMKTVCLRSAAKNIPITRKSDFNFFCVLNSNNPDPNNNDDNNKLFIFNHYFSKDNS